MLSWSWKELILFGAVILLIFLIAYVNQLYERKTTYIFQSTQSHRELLKLFLRNQYYPTLYLPSAWTKMAYWFDKKTKKPEFSREIFQYEDGGETALDYYPRDFNKLDGPILVLIPGLNGETEDHYISYTARHAFDQLGFRTVVFNKRGFAGVPLKGKYIVPWTRHEDFEAVLAHLKKNSPGSLVFVIGFSMGANFTEFFLGLKGERGEPSGVAAAVAVSPPHNMFLGSKKVTKNKALTKAVLRETTTHILKHENSEALASMLEHCGITAQELRNVTDLHEYDSMWTCKLLEMNTPEEYYRYISGATRMEHIATPLLAISSEKDPLIAHEGLEVGKIKNNPNIFQVVVRNGGHIEYCHGCNNQNWAVLRGLDFFKFILETHSLI